MFELAVDRDSGIAQSLPLRPPARAKHERDPYSDDSDMPDLYAGMQVVVRLYEGGDVAGYLGGILLDWHEPRQRPRWWRSGTRLIYQIVAVSQGRHRDLIGRLRSCTAYGYSWRRGGELVELGGSNWTAYKLEGPR